MALPPWHCSRGKAAVAATKCQPPPKPTIPGSRLLVPPSTKTCIGPSAAAVQMYTEDMADDPPEVLAQLVAQMQPSQQPPGADALPPGRGPLWSPLGSLCLPFLTHMMRKGSQGVTT